MSYFRLETLPLEPIDHLNMPRHYEELAEFAPSDYRPPWVIDEGYYGYDESGREIPLPEAEGTRCVFRWFGGAFVFFCKGKLLQSVSWKTGCLQCPPRYDER
jgi:hypothetical protein